MKMELLNIMLDQEEIPLLVTKNFEMMSHVKGYYFLKANLLSFLFSISNFFFFYNIHKQKYKISKSNKMLQAQICYYCIILLPK